MGINKKLYRSGPYADLFSQGVQVGNGLYMAGQVGNDESCLLYTSPSPRDGLLSRMPSSA